MTEASRTFPMPGRSATLAGLSTQVGTKALMALSGLAMAGWLLLHMLGNLLVFAGAETMNQYGAALQGSPLIWLMRVGLVVLVGIHIVSALKLTRTAGAATPERYRHRRRHNRATLASRTMRWGGLALGLFIAYHLLHIYGPLHASYVSGDPYHNLASAMADPIVAAVYTLATAALALHLWHGTWSAAVTLGASERAMRVIRPLAIGYVAVVTLGFLAPMAAGQLGLIGS